MHNPSKQPLRYAALWLALFVATSGCSSGHYIWVHDLPPTKQARGQRNQIGIGDTVEIRVYGDEKLNTRGRVLADGTLVMPLLGPVLAAGKKPEDLGSDLETALKRYMSVPSVTVLLQEAQVSVAVIGEVKQPGVVAVDAPASVLHALAKAGGMTEFADSSGIFVLRPNGAKTLRIRFKYSALTQAEPLAAGFCLRTGDTLVVE